MKVMGIDPSTRTGIVVLEDFAQTISVVSHTEIRTPGELGMTRVQSIGQHLAELLVVHKPDVAVIEGYAYGAKGRSITTMVEIGTVLRLTLHRDMPGRWAEASPSALKKFTTGKGNSKKDLVMLNVFKAWGFEGTDNECDAFGLAALGLYAGVPGLNPALKATPRDALQDWRIENRRTFD